MDSNECSKVIAFDTLFCTNHIQMLKIILPYMDNQTQKSMAIYIKFLELNYTIEFFKKRQCRQQLYSLCGCAENEISPDLFKMCTELLPYCTENEKKQLEQIRNIFQGMEMYREMSKTMDMMKDFMPDMSDFMNFAPDINAFAASMPTETADENSADHTDCSGETQGSPTSQDNNFHESTNSSSTNSASSSGSTGSFDMMNLLTNMLSPEQKQMFEMFGGNQHEQ